MLFLEPVTPAELAAHPTIARLAELGWVENRTLTIERAYANAEVELLPGLAQRLVGNSADVIWVDEPDGARAAARATSTTPIVFCGIPFPVEQGLVESYARPRRNLTGVANSTGTNMSNKRIALLKEIVPKVRRLAWLFPGDALGKPEDLSPYENGARKAGYDPVIYLVNLRPDLDAIFKEILNRRTEALTVGESPTLLLHRERIVRFATTNRLPSAYLNDSFVDVGGLVSFGPDRFYTRKTSGEYIDRILRGAVPASTPVEQPKTFSTVVNLKTAKLLGLTVPPSVLLQATRVVS